MCSVWMPIPCRNTINMVSYSCFAVVVIGFNQTEYPVLETDRAATVYVTVLLGGLQRRVSVTFSTGILRSDSATGKSDQFLHFCIPTIAIF